MDKHKVYISVGSNMGDPLNNCRKGIEAVCEDGSVEFLSRSPFYKTQPVDFEDQEWFVNGAFYVQTGLSPLRLLDKLQGIQKSMGRKPDGVRFGPRILDLDIILYDDLIFHSSRLIIPHPRMHKRRFVLQPICDIDPDVKHPRIGQTVQELLKQLVTGDQDIVPCS